MIKALKRPAKSFWLTALLSGCFWSLPECTGFSSQEVSFQTISLLPAFRQVCSSEHLVRLVDW